MKLLTDRIQIATFIAMLFHISGCIAIICFQSQLFIRLTPLNLLISFLLIVWTQRRINTAFVLFLLCSYCIGILAEWVGVHTGVLFGVYEYGAVLGPAWNGVPWIIGINWFIIVYCLGVVMHMLHDVLEKYSGRHVSYGWWRHFSVVVDGALLAVFFDWVLEPVALRLGFWSWSDGCIPALNYLSWFGICICMLMLFQLFHFNKRNPFAVHLLLIQTMFFLLLRTFL